MGTDTAPTDAALEAQAAKDRGLRIKRLRQESTYTQKALAAKVGVLLRTYQKWEAGAGIEWANLEKLAAAHGVEVRWIATGEREQPPEIADALGRILTEVAELQSRLTIELSEVQAEVAGVRAKLDALIRNNGNGPSGPDPS
jgi:transcriptional regulator with XRE-family HTH domain